MNLSSLRHLETSGTLLLDLGLQPVSNRFLSNSDISEAPRFPMQLRICTDSGLLHIGKTFPVDELKPRYEWLTCFEPEDHLDDLVDRLIALPDVTKCSTFGAYSFKDDSTLRRLERRGYAKTWRIDPAQDLGVVDKCANVETYQSVATRERGEKVKERYGAADVFIVRHVVEHAFDLPEFIDFIRCMVRPGGYIVWELPDCEGALKVGDCTTLWEEHAFYFTGFTFRHLLQAAGFSVVHFESVPYVLENSIVAIVREAAPGTSVAEPDGASVAGEVARATDFAQAFVRRRTAVRAKLEAIHRERGPIALFGAGHLSVAFLSLMGVADLIACVLDDNPNKKGMRMPLGGLQILGSETLYSGGIRTCLLGLNPQNQPKVVASHARFAESGGIFASIFPGSKYDLDTLR